MCSDSRARSQSTTSFLPQMPAIHGASSSRSLCAALGESGSIVVYSSFESQRLSDLASWFPEFADRINAIQARLFDLLPVVRGHTLSSGIRRVVLHQVGLARARAEMTYDGMQVANGQDAGLAWESLVRGSWTAPSAAGSGRLCWTIAGRTLWRWSDFWTDCDCRSDLPDPVFARPNTVYASLRASSYSRLSSTGLLVLYT